MSIILDVLNNKKFEKPPVWFMRQAGRHLPEYINVRRRFSNLMEMFKDSDICAEITVQPVQRYNLDAEIIFTDILMIHMVTGADVSFDNIDGPKVIEAQKKTVDFNNIKFLLNNIKLSHTDLEFCEVLDKMCTFRVIFKNLVDRENNKIFDFQR